MRPTREVEMADSITLDEIKDLAAPEGGPHVSIYLPLQPVAESSAQDPIRLRNLLARAESELVETGLRSRESASLLAPVRALGDDSRFWQAGGAGLGVFVSARGMRVHRLPTAVDDLLVVGHRFHVKPLLSLLDLQGRFYVLALSKKRVRLLSGTNSGLDEVDAQGIPASLAEALGFDSFERQLQHRSVGPNTSGGSARPVMFHGHGAPTDDMKVRLLEWFHRVDEGVSEYLRGKDVPLVLAGVDYLRAIYREANSYPGLVSGGIPGSADETDTERLLTSAWDLAAPVFGQRRARAEERYARRMGSDRVSADLATVLAAADAGRVDTLFVALDESRWGVFDPETGDVREADPADRGADELLDRATVLTLSHGGSVYGLPARELPQPGEVAALFRY